MKLETIARLALIAILATLPASVWVGRNLPFQNASKAGEKMVELHASMPESGGWSPSTISIQEGQTLHLRLTSDDVVHSFAIGQSSQPPIDLNPGEVKEINLKFDQPGTYTFYCTRWCGPNHWRMRGTIEVIPNDGQSTGQQAQSGQPLYTRLGINLDAKPPSMAPPALMPSANRGAGLGIHLPEEFSSKEYYRTHSPFDLFQSLKTLPLGQKLSSQPVWDLVAWAWQSQSDPEVLIEGQKLYAQNCASCHGEAGAGNGVFAKSSQSASSSSNQGMPGMGSQPQTAIEGHETLPPANFTDPGMLAQNPARWQGKILRGGMGTGMPYWGPIFTDSQTWAIVDYLWTFSMEYNHEKN